MDRVVCTTSKNVVKSIKKASDAKNVLIGKKNFTRNVIYKRLLLQHEGHTK